MIPTELQEKIIRILKKGNTVELKKERGNLVIVEIKRNVTDKVPM